MKDTTTENSLQQNRVTGFESKPVRLIGTLLLAAGLLSLTACSGGRYGDLEAFFEEVRSQPKGRIDPLPEVLPYETFVYKPAEVRDPFVQYIEELVTNIDSDLRPDMNRKREPLEQYPLDTLEFVGHLEKSGVRWGLISAPDKSVYRVQIGNYVGKNYGKIVSINETSIKLVEIIPSGTGSWVDREASLALNE